MRRTDNGTSPAGRPDYRVPERGPLPDLALYERLIDNGIADADSQGTIIDHVTARRLAIWLAARPQEQDFARGLVRFIETGAITPELKAQLRRHARSGAYPHHQEAARLLRYGINRGAELDPIDGNFAMACDQLDRADAMLARLHDRSGQGQAVPEQAWCENGGPPILALARRDPENQTINPRLDVTTANTAMFTIATHADEREAHKREIELSAQSLPEGSYGRRNRQAIAAREARVARRLRAIERAYRAAVERDATSTLPGAPRAIRSPERTPDREIELELPALPPVRLAHGGPTSSSHGTGIDRC
jgi:hypothetical protein